MPTTCLNYDKKCGGCPLLALPYREQLNQKQARLQGLLGGFAPVRAVQGMAEPYHYRNKAIASFAMQHGRLVCGLYAEGTHRVLPSADCLLQEEILSLLLAEKYGLLLIMEQGKGTRYEHLRPTMVALVAEQIEPLLADEENALLLAQIMADNLVGGIIQILKNRVRPREVRVCMNRLLDYHTKGIHALRVE